MKFEQSTDRMIKLFNQSIECLHLSKTKSLLFAFLLVGALVTLLTVPVQAAPQSRWATRRHFQHPAFRPLYTSGAGPWPRLRTDHGQPQ